MSIDKLVKNIAFGTLALTQSYALAIQDVQSYLRKSTFGSTEKGVFLDVEGLKVEQRNMFKDDKGDVVVNIPRKYNSISYKICKHEEKYNLFMASGSQEFELVSSGKLDKVLYSLIESINTRDKSSIGRQLGNAFKALGVAFYQQASIGVPKLKR